MGQISPNTCLVSGSKEDVVAILKNWEICISRFLWRNKTIWQLCSHGSIWQQLAGTEWQLPFWAVSACQLAPGPNSHPSFTCVTCLALQASQLTAFELPDTTYTPSLSCAPLPAFPLCTAAILNHLHSLQALCAAVFFVFCFLLFFLPGRERLN